MWPYVHLANNEIYAVSPLFFSDFCPGSDGALSFYQRKHFPGTSVRFFYPFFVPCIVFGDG